MSSNRPRSKRPSGPGLPGTREPVESEGPAQAAWVYSALKVLVGFGIVLGAAGVVAWGAYRFLTTTSRFAVESVEVVGSRRYSDAHLLALAGIKRGDNLFGIDLETAERKLTENPWIESAQVGRKLPDKLLFEVQELTAQALAAVDGTLYLVTLDGQPIKPLESGDHSDYPVITGISADQLLTDRALALERIATGINIVEQYRRIPISKGFIAQEVQMDADGRVNMTIGTPAVTLQLGRGPFRQKLLMAGRIIADLRRKGETPGLVFLDSEAHPERVVVRMR